MGHNLRMRVLAILSMLLMFALALATQQEAGAQYFPEYVSYVHTFLDAQGNWTYMEKAMFPVLFNGSQIGIGRNWSIVVPLQAGHTYHAYCYGSWISNGSEPKTDYDMYVYDASGLLEGYHTEAAGLPEHLGSVMGKPFFTPKTTGNYTFVIHNDPRESSGSQQATFMIIEDNQCNIWHRHYVEGKNESSQPVLNTAWAYEFATNSQRIELWVRVPEEIDMYEARLYLMNQPYSQNNTTLNGVSLAWEPGLYGERSNGTGGYNLESKEYRGVAYASCEDYGQDMFLNYTSPYERQSLYHLVLIGEEGNGTLEFLVKTEFESAALEPVTVPNRVYPQSGTSITYVSQTTDLLTAILVYSIDNWKNATSLDMEIANNRTCTAIIPGQEAGTLVSYRVEARDVLESMLYAENNFTVKKQSSFNISLVRSSIYEGEAIIVRGYLVPEEANLSVKVSFKSGNTTNSTECLTLKDGTFTTSFQPHTIGTWDIQARFEGDSQTYPTTSLYLSAKVEEATFLMKYGIYLGGGGVGATAIAGVIIYIKKFRG